MEAPAYTANYVNKSMQKLYTPPAKRQATAMNVETTIEVAQTAQTARTSPTTYAVAVTPTIPVTPCITTILPDTSENKVVRELQATTMEHSSTLAELRKCYTTLATTQQQLATKYINKWKKTSPKKIIINSLYYGNILLSHIILTDRKHSLNGLELTDEQKQEIVDEANMVFDLNIGILQELEGSATKAMLTLAINSLKSKLGIDWWIHLVSPQRIW